MKPGRFRLAAPRGDRSRTRRALEECTGRLTQCQRGRQVRLQTPCGGKGVKQRGLVGGSRHALDLGRRHAGGFDERRALGEVSLS